MNVMPRSHFKLWAVGAGCGIIALAGSVALSPAFAGKTVNFDHSCNGPSPCLIWKQHGTGPAILGWSQVSNGIVGQTIENSKTTGFAGVIGSDMATPNPSGTPYNNAGVQGDTATGTGVFGQATSGTGVRGIADSGTALVGNSNGGAGVFGTTQSNITGISSAGVFGEDVGNTSLAMGVLGFSGTGIGVQADQFERGKYLNAAFLGMTFASSITTYFPAKPPGGLFNSDIGEGVVAESAGSQAETLAAANFGGGPLMRMYAATTEIMDLDNGGNMILKGGLTQHGNPHVVTTTSGAGDVVMYSPAQAEATVEDVGEAQLAGGQAYVRLDPRFSATMDRSRPYLVFITPQGDTAGLYVTEKSSLGFSVREHGGRSSTVFDYRIVARPYASNGARLAPAPRLTAHGFSGSFTRKTSDLLVKRGLIVQH